DSSSSIIIDSIKVTQTPAFAITRAPSLPDTIPSQGSFAVGLAYHRSSQGSDNGELVIHMPDEPILPAISLQGVRVANNAVQTQPAGSVYFWLYPNPSQGGITIHTEHLTHAHVTVTDVLGRIEREASFVGDWQWGRKIEGGGLAPAGTYFVIVTGEDASGTTVRELERVALE
ncbi:MAG TPA: T9SS type A sorting domain-containing protein, partial [Candidatus Kapabacteria bacterium]|nr:T9SS type A sorting domain-containing protein [Candidatus Kapabacteria bacterium]